MEARVAALEKKLENYDRAIDRITEMENGLAELNTIKEDFGIKLRDRLDLMQAEITSKSDFMVNDLKKVISDAIP